MQPLCRSSSPFPCQDSWYLWLHIRNMGEAQLLYLHMRHAIGCLLGSNRKAYSWSTADCKGMDEDRGLKCSAAVQQFSNLSVFKALCTPRWNHRECHSAGTCTEVLNRLWFFMVCLQSPWRDHRKPQHTLKKQIYQNLSHMCKWEILEHAIDQCDCDIINDRFHNIWEIETILICCLRTNLDTLQDPDCTQIGYNIFLSQRTVLI